jgi:phosphatidylglycerol:prolipoprotein diacylglycerol transferase
VLFEISGVQIGSYGVCLALAFLVNFPLFQSEARRLNIPKDAVDYIFFSALIGGMLGGKLLYLFESLLRGDYQFPESYSLTGGFAALGGFVLAFVLSSLVIRIRHYPAGSIFNAVAPGLMLAYGIARIGCQLSGDGDYGVPSELPWAMAYPNGILPTLVRVHPTPIYETITSLVIFVYLWRSRLKFNKPFELFAIYLVLSGLARFMVEFIRRNPEAIFGLTASQIIAMVGTIVGACILFFLHSSNNMTVKN